MEIPAWRIGLDGSEARIGTRGGVALSWTVPDGHGGVLDVLDGYRDRSERRRGDGARQALLVPWSNRIRGSRYSWGGVDLDLGPDAHGVRQALHGLALWAGFELVEEADAGVRLRARLTHPEYPVPLCVEARYALGHSREPGGGERWSLELTLSARNVGDVDAPVGLGWHPYVRHLGGASGARVEVPASLHVRTDAALIPWPGAEAFEASDAADAPGDVDGGGTVVITDPHGLDDAWTGLHAPGDRVSVTLHHATGARTRLEAVTRLDGLPGAAQVPPGALPALAEPTPTPGIGVVQLFTGEPLEDRPHHSLAMEYCQFMTDAFNRAELHDALRLAPGATRTLVARLVHIP